MNPKSKFPLFRTTAHRRTDKNYTMKFPQWNDYNGERVALSEEGKIVARHSLDDNINAAGN